MRGAAPWPDRAAAQNPTKGETILMQYSKRWLLALCASLLILSFMPGSYAQQLPDGWKSEDIGDPDLPGKTTFDAATGTYTIVAGGSDIWGTSDSMHFAYRTLPGNGSITMRFVSRSGVAPTAPSKSGPMMRAGNEADAASAYLPFQGDRNMDPHYRFEQGGGTTNFEIENRGRIPTEGNPIWQRIERQGNRFSSLISDDGRVWTSLVSVEMPNMPATVLAGIAATKHGATGGDDPVTAVYDNVTVGTDLSPQNLSAIARDKGALVMWSAVPGADGYNVYTQGADLALNKITVEATKNTSIEVQNLENGKPATIVVTAIQGGKEGIGVRTVAIPSPPILGTFQGVNINTVQAGSQTVDANGLITVQGAGHAIGSPTGFSGRSDGFYFLAMPQTGNATATVRVVAGPNAEREDDNRQAGIIFRETLDQDARFVMMEITSGSGARLQRRTAVSAQAEATDAEVADPAARPVWLRVVRNGNVFTAFVAEDKDGQNFRQVGDPITIDGFSSQAYVGIALSPHNGFNARPPGGIEFATAQFDNLSVK
jgi:hypothetical protein